MRPTKKNPNKDLRPWSFLFFIIGLASMTWLADYALDFKTIYGLESNKTETTQVVATSGSNTDEAEEEFRVLQIDAEEIENLVNTIAYTHAVWPGYKGDVLDGPAVRKHFSENLAKIIVNSRVDELYKNYKIHFYYVVRDDGIIQYLAIVDGGRTSPDLPVYLIKNTQRIMGIGVPGVKPGTDDKGNPITVVYELVINFQKGNQ